MRVAFTLILTVSILKIVSPDCMAQFRKKSGDNNTVQIPKIEYKSPSLADLDSNKTSEVQLFPDKNITNPAYNKSIQELKKELAMLHDDTVDLELFEEEYLLGVDEEQMPLDSIWMTLYDYYAIWSTKAVNPYKIDGSKFSDRISLTLYDTLSGMHWYPPLANTYITSNFGMRRTRWHYGTDLKLQIGDTVSTVFDGIVRIVKNDPRGYGNYVLVRHVNGLETLYGHLSEQLVQVGQVVKAGEPIGLGGNTGRSTGPHLHFEIRYQGNAINPSDLYDFNKNLLKYQDYVISPQSFAYLKEAKKAVYHNVVRGDTLYKISRRYGVPVATIAKMNKMTTKSTLRVGQKLRVR